MFANLNINGPPKKNMTTLLFHSFHNNNNKKNTTKKPQNKSAAAKSERWVKKKSALLQVRKQNDSLKGEWDSFCQCASVSPGQCSDSWGLAHMYELTRTYT